MVIPKAMAPVISVPAQGMALFKSVYNRVSAVVDIYAVDDKSNRFVKPGFRSWERSTMSEGQTVRGEDNAFIHLSPGQVSLLCLFCQNYGALSQVAERPLKRHT